MTGSASGEPKIRACTVCRDVRNFDLLIEDMEAIYADTWGELTFIETVSFLDDPDASELELLAIALDDEDSAQTNLVRLIIERAAAKSIRVLLIAESLSPILLHQMLRAGADDFVPYPLPENALRDAIERLRKAAQTAAGVQTAATPSGRNGTIFAVQSLAGGAGATTFAVNLAWELMQTKDKSDMSVCILDLDFQSGTVSTYLDLPRTEKVYEMLSQTSTMDRDSFFSALQRFQEKLHVLTAPSDMLPLDLLSPDEIERVISIAGDSFDIVVIDMPRTIVHWTETVLSASEQYFAIMELDMRSAQNTLRLIRALKADGLSMDRFHFVLNRAPRFTDLGGRSRAKRMAESLGISFTTFIPDGGAQVRDANDHGLPLGEFAAKNPAGKEIRKLAQSISEARNTAKIAAE